jgi:hypothetical protein
MKKIKDLIASNGVYKNATGEEKNRWVTVGGLYQDGNKMTIKIDNIPVGGSWNGWLSCKDPKPFESNNQKREFDDDLAF